ncbi:MAG: hypothetical protein GY817_05970 [bacterium]|nr:hypothetical protein [bacterium]
MKFKKICPNYLYICSPFSDLFFINFLKRVKVKIVLEFPTYPYYREVKGFKTQILFFFDKFFRMKIYKYVDVAVSYTNFEEIFKIKIISINNGVSFERL